MLTNILFYQNILFCKLNKKRVDARPCARFFKTFQGALKTTRDTLTTNDRITDLSLLFFRLFLPRCYLWIIRPRINDYDEQNAHVSACKRDAFWVAWPARGDNSKR